MAAGVDRGQDWRRLAGLAMTRLGWGPEIFWSATPADLMAAVEALGARSPGAPPLERAGLQALLARFPDVDPAAAAGR